MLAMPAVAVALNINSVVIENVPNVINDSGGVVQKTVELFESHGYKVQQGVITARSLGWPQTRKRYFIVARLDKNPLAFESVVETLRMPPQGISWAIDDLLDVKAGSGLMHSTPTLSKENLERIEWLFKNKKYDLENHMRPKCHQDGHTYPAVYGRMKWDEPAPTITGGFQTPGRGRFIHPKRKRVLTPNEAARIQGFPDWFDFESASMNGPTRTMLGKWIGDAVPSMLGAAAVLSAIG
jgi:DNA (cytosine-5)-methyltransferase 1